MSKARLGLRSALAAVALVACGAVHGEAPAQDSAVARDGEEEPVFDVWEYRVKGNRLLARTQVERAVYPFLGPQRTIDDVERAREALEALYRGAGFGTVLVDIPEQDVVGGIVRLTVTEGRVERLRITGSRYFSLGRIRRQMPALAEGSVPNFPLVQQQLAEVNAATPDRRVTPVLRPGITPGTVEVELEVEDELPVHGSIEVNDRFSRDTTRTRLNASLSYNNLWQREHGLTLGYQVAPQDRDEAEVFSASYLFRVPQADANVALFAVRSRSDVATVGTLGVLGQGTIAGARLSFALPAGGGWRHSLTLGGDYKSFEESVRLQGADSLDTPIDYLSFMAQYGLTLLGESTLTRFGASVHLAPRGFGNTEQEFADKRFRARPDFFYVRASAERVQPLSADWSLFARVQGQVAGLPLISNEQFAAGGADSVRGYPESASLGDDGITARLEIRTPSLAEALWQRLSELRFHAFSDAARLRVQDPLPGQGSGDDLWSVGVGLRVAASGVDAELAWARALRAASDIERGDSRIHFRLGYAF